MFTGSQLLVMDSHTTYGMVTIQKHLRFHLEGTPIPTFSLFQFLFRFKRALSPYMVQEVFMADGSASEVLWTHVQHKDISD
jgi:hypothetical protein